jgi:hypothetical protein
VSVEKPIEAPRVEKERNQLCPIVDPFPE